MISRLALIPLQDYNCAVSLREQPCPSVAMTCSNGLRAQIPLRGYQVTLQRVQQDRMDAFSEILSGVKLNGAVFFTAEFSAPWGFSVPASKQMA